MNITTTTTVTVTNSVTFTIMLLDIKGIVRSLGQSLSVYDSSLPSPGINKHGHHSVGPTQLP